MKTALTQPQIDVLYTIFAEFDAAAAEVGLPYSMAAGTALGAVRHAGLIPWDDDGDLYAVNHQFMSLIYTLWTACKKRNLRIEMHQLDGIPAQGWYKIYLEGHTIPNVDVFLLAKEDGGAYHLANASARTWWPKESLWPDQLARVERVPFGPLSLPLFGNAQDYLSRVYGHDWHSVAWDGYDHVNEKMRAPRSNARHIASYAPALPSWS